MWCYPLRKILFFSEKSLETYEFSLGTNIFYTDSSTFRENSTDTDSSDIFMVLVHFFTISWSRVTRWILPSRLLDKRYFASASRQIYVLSDWLWHTPPTAKDLKFLELQFHFNGITKIIFKSTSYTVSIVWCRSILFYFAARENSSDKILQKTSLFSSIECDATFVNNLTMSRVSALKYFFNTFAHFYGFEPGFFSFFFSLLRKIVTKLNFMEVWKKCTWFCFSVEYMAPKWSLALIQVSQDLEECLCVKNVSLYGKIYFCMAPKKKKKMNQSCIMIININETLRP